MWDKIWEFAIQHHFYQTIVLLYIIGFVLNIILKSKIIQGWSGKVTRFKIGAGGVEVERKQEDSEKDKQQDGIVNQILVRLGDIEKRLDSQYGFIKNAVIQSGIGIIWSGAKPPPFVEVANAALLNILLGANGNQRKRLLSVILEHGEHGITDFTSLKEKFINENKNRLDQYFYDTMAWLDKQLH
jgi:hypothetical protein